MDSDQDREIVSVNVGDWVSVNVLENDPVSVAVEVAD